jgi:2-hydroxy-3-keto-5-methylthiopentenyl-1-phosphate phosphatase
MEGTYSLQDIVIISDFDGTITLQDSNNLLFKTFGNDENKNIEKLYAKGTIGTKEGMIEHFSIMKLSEGTYSEFIEKKIEMDKGFKQFYNFISKKNIPFIVVSGGFTNCINLVFKREKIILNNIYANKLIFNENNAKPIFLHEIESCNGNFKTCGNCKLYYLEKYRSMGKKVIFIGDGLTDRCIASQSDIVYAKGALEKHCKCNKIQYIKYNDFYDITDSLMEMMI